MSTATVTPDTTVRDSAPATTSSKRRALSDAPTGLRAALIASLVPVYYLALLTLPNPADTHGWIPLAFAGAVGVFAFLALAATGRFGAVPAPTRGAYLALSAVLIAVGALAVADGSSTAFWLASGIGSDSGVLDTLVAFRPVITTAIHLTALVLVARIVLPRRGSK